MVRPAGGPVDEDPAQELARGGPWDGVDEVDRADPLVRRDPLGDPGHERVGVDLAAGDHQRNRDLAVGGVRARNERGLSDGRDRLELGGRHLVGADPS
jgi:hypothetical protein